MHRNSHGSRRRQDSRRRQLAILVLLVWSVSGVAPASAGLQTRYPAVIAFGDSLSDTGNLASAVFNFPFPYYRNRISDGPVALDYLMESMQLTALASELGGTNFAVAGGNIIGTDREDLIAQVNDYLARQIDPGNALIFVMAGGNDLRDIRGTQNEVAAQAQIDAVIAGLIAQMERLAQSGARHFFVTNVPNVGRIPETLNKQSGDPGIAARATRYVRAYNAELASALDGFARNSDRSVYLFDLFAELERLLDAPASFGFLQTQVGCFDPGNFSFHPDCLFGTRFERFVFFDNIHPTGASNRLIGEAMVAGLQASARGSGQAALPAVYLLLLLDDAPAKD